MSSHLYDNKNKNIPVTLTWYQEDQVDHQPLVSQDVLGDPKKVNKIIKINK